METQRRPPQQRLSAMVKDPAANGLGIGITALAGAVIATFSDAAPTVVGWWNAVLIFVLVVSLVVAASKAPRWATMLFSTGAMLGADVDVWGGIGLLGLVVAVAAALLDRRSRLLGAIACALSLQLMLRWPGFGFFGLPSAISAVLMLLVWIQGYRYANLRSRKLVRRGLTALVLVTTIGLVVGAVQLLSARPDIERGLESGRRAVTAVGDGNPESLATELAAAERSLVQAHESVQRPAARFLRFVPVVAQHYEALDTSLDHGKIIAAQAASTANDSSIQSVSLELGKVELSTLATLEPGLRSTAEKLQEAIQAIGASRSGWLLGPIGTRVDDAIEELAEVERKAEVAADAAATLPEMLGQTAPRRYLTMFGTPTEAREFGGLFGSWALIEFDDGQIELVDSGRVNRLRALGQENGLTADRYPEWFVEFAMPNVFPQGITGTPSGTVVAAAAQELFSGVGGGEIDGVIYLDAVALIDLLDITGPVQMPFQEEPLDRDNAAQFFFRDQYEFETGQERTEAFSRLSEVAGVVLQRVSSTRLPGPEQLGSVLGPAARAGHLQVFTYVEEENEFLHSVQLQRQFGVTQAQDYVALIHSNIFGNKLDLYLERSLRYEATVDEDGGLRALATATFTSNVPRDAPSYVLGREETESNNRLAASFYTPHVLVQARLDGIPTAFTMTEEYGLKRYVVDLTVAPDGTPRVLEFELVGLVDPSVDYSIELWRQALVNNDQVDIAVEGNGTSTVFSGMLTETLRISPDQN